MGNDRLPPPRGSLLDRGSTVTSGGTRYEKSPVGDRLEFITSQRYDRASVTHEDYDDYLRSFGSSRSGSVSKSDRRRGRYGRRSRKGKKKGFDEVPPGITVEEVARKIIPRRSVRLTAAILSALIVGILAHNIFMGFYVQYTTEKVTVSKYIETIDTEGIAIREEIILEGKLSDTSVREVRNGDKVSMGETILRVYTSVQDAAAYERVSEIERESEELKGMITASEDNPNAVDSISQLLDAKMIALNHCAQERSVAKIGSIKSDIINLLNKRMVAMRQVDEYNSRIEQLEKEKETLLKKLKKEPKTVKSEYSGYYADTCDGYEELLTPSMVKTLTAGKLDGIMNSEVAPKKNVIGKLVSDFSWYLACPVSAMDSDYLKTDSLYRLYLPYSDAENIEATLERVNKEEGADTFLAIFRINTLASELWAVRRQPVRIQKCSYEGYVIKKSALHAGLREEIVRNPRPESDFPRAHLVYINQVIYPSVYAVVGRQVNEKEVSIVYSNDKTVICTPKQGNSNYLSQGDTVVIEERGLYDGKLVR